jgi:hypothetical protein
MWGELNARNAFQTSGTRSASNALLAEHYLLSYSILYYISVPERVPDVWNALLAEHITDVGEVWTL